MVGKIVTLEIDSTAIRLMETRGGRVVKWASLSLEPGMVEGEAASDPQAVGSAVEQLMASSGIKAQKVIASVSGLYSVSRIVMVSGLPGEPTTRESVLEAARDVIPLSEDEMYLSWQVVAAGERERQVLVVGVPRDTIDDEVQALKAAGIKPHILELRAMALMRAVNREQAIILNIEPASFDVIMVVDGIAEVMRTSSWQQGENPGTGEDRVEHLAVNLELVVGFYNSRHPGFPLDPATPLFITGQMSGDLTLVEKLRARTKYPIEPLAPLLEYPSHLPVSQYAVNIGLALKEAASSREPEQGGYLLPDINLLPQAHRPWRPSTRQVYSFLAIMAATALLFPVFQLTSGAMDRTNKLQAEYDFLNGKLQVMQVEINKREPMKKAIAEYHTIVDMGSGFTGDLEVINSRAEELGVEVRSVTHEGDNIAVTCGADDYITFRDYLAALEGSGRFSSPVSPAEGYGWSPLHEGHINLEPGTGE